MKRSRLAASLFLGLFLGAAGWRGDGSGVMPGALPAGWSAATALWSVALERPGNASVVRFGELVCVTEEPASVHCFDAASGRRAWSGDLSLGSIGSPEAVAAEKEGEALEAELSTLQRRYGDVRKALRRDAGPTVRAELDEVTRRLAEVQARLEALAPRLAPKPDAGVGWMSPTPVADGQRLYVHSSVGTVAAFDLGGVRVWARDLGRPSREHREFRGDPTASPLRAGGVLVVAHDRLLGLDPATGATRWTSVAYRDFGTPAVVRAGGRELLATPDGHLIDARDGAEVASGLGDVLFVGPVAHGASVFYAGRATDSSLDRPAEAVAARVEASGGAVKVATTWRVPLGGERYYAGPVVFDGQLVAIDRRGHVTRLDLATGAVLGQTDLPLPVGAEVWPSPLVAGDRLLVQTDEGTALVLDSELNVVGRGTGPRILASPLLDGERLYLRSNTGLMAFPAGR